jgi:opacity protein-like surface antigen
MKKLILSVAILTLGVLSANAQRGSEDKTVKISIGAEGALPMSDLKTTSKFGFGGSAQAEFEVSDNIGVTLSAGYLTFSGKTISIPVSFDPITMQPIYGPYKVPSVNIIPVLAGAKIYFTEKVYGSAQAGWSFFSAKGSSSANGFTYAPGIGFYVCPNFDLLVKYQGSTKDGSTISFLGLRAAYSF